MSTFSRAKWKSRKKPPNQILVSTTNGLSAHVRPLKVDVDLVLVPVTITDPMNRLVTGLDKENFQLYEGNSSQQIRTFSAEDAPVSLGVIFDSSGSMNSKDGSCQRGGDRVLQDGQPARRIFHDHLQRRAG